MSLSVCYPHHPWSLFLQPPLLPPSQPSSLCPSIPFVRAVLALFLFIFLCCDTVSAEEKREEGKNKTRNGKHLQRWRTMVSVGLGADCSRFFFDVTHTRRDRRTLFHTHHPNPGTYHLNLCELTNFPVSFLSINMTITIRAWHGRSRPEAPPTAPWSPDTLLRVCTLPSTVLALWKWWLKQNQSKQ